jgi:hypothetical protein
LTGISATVLVWNKASEGRRREHQRQNGCSAEDLAKRKLALNHRTGATHSASDDWRKTGAIAANRIKLIASQ